jgi:hypothetical protein
MHGTPLALRIPGYDVRRPPRRHPPESGPCGRASGSDHWVLIWTRPRCQGALGWNNTLRDRCSHISGLLVKTFQSLRALMKSALPRLITTTASRALYLRRLRGSRSDRSCHQLDYTSHCAESLL